MRTIFQIEKTERKKVPVDPYVAVSVQQTRLERQIDKEVSQMASAMNKGGNGADEKISRFSNAGSKKYSAETAAS